MLSAISAVVFSRLLNIESTWPHFHSQKVGCTVRGLKSIFESRSWHLCWQLIRVWKARLEGCWQQKLLNLLLQFAFFRGGFELYVWTKWIKNLFLRIWVTSGTSVSISNPHSTIPHSRVTHCSCIQAYPCTGEIFAGVGHRICLMQNLNSGAEYTCTKLASEHVNKLVIPHMFPSCRDLHKVLWTQMSNRLDLLKTSLNPHCVVSWWKANRSGKVSLLLCCLATVLPLPPAWCCLLSHCEWWYFAAFYVLGDENLPCFPIPCLPSATDTLLSKYQAHTHTYTHTWSTPQQCFQPATTQWCKLGGWICHQLKKRLAASSFCFPGVHPSAVGFELLHSVPGLSDCWCLWLVEIICVLLG